MKLIKQTTEYNCGAACLAMVADLETVAEAERLIGRLASTPIAGIQGLGIRDECVGFLEEEIGRVLFELGIPHLNVLPHERYASGDTPWRSTHHQHLRAPGLEYFDRHLMAGGRAIATVPSKNYEGGWHAIAFEGMNIFDPSRNKTYTNDDFPLSVSDAQLIWSAPKLTDAQREALRWLRDRNGDGLFDRNGVFTAAGERAPFMRSTWNALRDAGYVEMYSKRRMRVVKATPV